MLVAASTDDVERHARPVAALIIGAALLAAALAFPLSLLSPPRAAPAERLSEGAAVIERDRRPSLRCRSAAARRDEVDRLTER